MAANEIRPQPKRLRYFNGLIMKEEEFILEQDYHVRMRRLHNRNLHDGGIITGLEVVIGNTPNEVLVKQGIALDRHFDPQFSEDVSRELVLTDDCEVDLSSYSPGDQVWIWISYAEEFVDVVPDRGGQEPIHIQESVVISHATNRPPNEGETDIPLAVVEIAVGGVVNQDAIKDSFDGQLIREKSAIKTDRLNVEVLSLRDPLIDDGNTPFLDGFRFEDTGDDGISVTSDRTRFSGVVDVDTRLNVGTDATVQGNLQVDQNATVTGDLTVNQNANITNDVTVSGQLNAQTELNALQDVIVTGNLRSVNPSGALELDDDLHVTGALQVGTGAAVTEISTDTTMVDDSDLAVPTERAVRTFVDERLAQLFSQELAGFVAAFGAGTPPVGWLECDGQALDRTTYARLFSIIGVNFGAGDGVNTFNVPDLRGEFVRGWDNGRGVDPGRSLGSDQGFEIQSHGHLEEVWSPLQTFNYLIGAGGVVFGQNFKGGFTAGGSETRPRNVALMYCIKI